MGPWNKLIVSLLALFLIVAAMVTLLVATGAVAPDFLPGGGAAEMTAAPRESWFQTQLEDLADYGGGAKAIAIAMTLVTGAAMLVLLAMQWSMGRKAAGLLISLTGDGGLSIEDNSVRYLAERTGLSNRQITDIRCRVQVRSKRSSFPARIIVTCYPRVTIGANIQEIRDDLQQRVKDTVEALTGLQVIRVDVARVRYERNDAPKLMGG